MDQSRQKKLIKKFGTAGINTYVHLGCLHGYAETPMKNPLKADGVNYIIESVDFLPAEGSNKGGNGNGEHCDKCGRIFGEFDGRVIVRITGVEELQALLE